MAVLRPSWAVMRFGATFALQPSQAATIRPLPPPKPSDARGGLCHQGPTQIRSSLFPPLRAAGGGCHSTAASQMQALQLAGSRRRRQARLLPSAGEAAQDEAAAARLAVLWHEAVGGSTRGIALGWDWVGKWLVSVWCSALLLNSLRSFVLPKNKPKLCHYLALE
jgi:hypothetical protein